VLRSASNATPGPRSPRAGGLLVSLAASLLLLGPLTLSVRAVEGPVMDAAVMLEGHARAGSWMAIKVHLVNSGPALVGELRLAGGAAGRTRYGVPVDLPTTSGKDYILYAQPPQFGGTIDVTLVADGVTVVKKAVAFTVHEAGQLVVGVVAERPERIVPKLDLLPSASGVEPAVVTLGVEDLPDRVEAWASLDRLIWQDIDTNLLSVDQIAALRGWLAGGGRLIVAGGTAGPAVLSGFPDDVLPYRPTATLDVPPASIAGLVGQLPADAADLPALGGELVRGRALATSGDRVIAAEAAYGSGVVTLLGFDPSTRWIADSRETESFWRGFLPPRQGGPILIGDDNTLVSVVAQLPELALPSIAGLIALLFGYILLIGPVNYLVLRRLDRREWAWITMPVLIAAFVAGSFGLGAAVRGLDVVLNEVAIVRGAPDTTEGAAQVYLGIFSPGRGTYQVEVQGGALLSSTLSGDFVNGGDAGSLDVLQGNPARIRDLVVGFGSLRTVRAETAAVVPRISADLRLVDGVLQGTITNLSDQLLEKPAVVLGGSVTVLNDLPPGSKQTVSLVIRRTNNFGEPLSNRILGAVFFGDPASTSGSTQRNLVRRAVIDQLTYDPTFGGSTGQLPAENPVLLAWGTRQVLDVRVSGQQPRRTGNVLFYIPLGMRIQGAAAFDSDLLRSSVVELDAQFFNKELMGLGMGRGSVTMAYRPIAFEGRLTPKRVLIGVNFGGEIGLGAGKPVALGPMDPQPCRDEPAAIPGCFQPDPDPACDPTLKECQVFEQVPEIELFDRTGAGSWVRLNHLTLGNTYDLASPERYVDPGSGTLLVRFVNEKQDSVGFTFNLRIEGDVS
jgi:hypothetical protein